MQNSRHNVLQVVSYLSEALFVNVLNRCWRLEILKNHLLVTFWHCRGSENLKNTFVRDCLPPEAAERGYDIFVPRRGAKFAIEDPHNMAAKVFYGGKKSRDHLGHFPGASGVLKSRILEKSCFVYKRRCLRKVADELHHVVT